MNDAPVWLPGVLTVSLTVAVGAFLLPIVESLYRVETWILTWPLLQQKRAERRDAFEVQLAAYLAEERRLGYQAQSSGLRLFVRMLSTLPIDICESSCAFAFRAYWFVVRLKIRYRLWTLGDS